MNCLWSGKLHKVQWEDQNMEASFFLFIFYSANQLCQLCGKWFKMDTRAVFYLQHCLLSLPGTKNPASTGSDEFYMCSGFGLNIKRTGHGQQSPPPPRDNNNIKGWKKEEKSEGKTSRCPHTLTADPWEVRRRHSAAATSAKHSDRSVETKRPRPPPPPDDHGRQNPVPKQWQRQAWWEKKKQFAVFTAVTACPRRPWRQSPLLYALCDGGLFIDLALCVYANDSTSMLHLLLRGERESCCFWLTRCSLCVCVCVFIPHALGSVCSGGAHVTQLSYYVEASWRAVHKTVYTLQSLFI